VAIERWDWLIFSMFPHLDHENLPDNSMANAEKWAAGVPVPGNAIDDQTAIKDDRW
jgi:dipeptidase E